MATFAQFLQFGPYWNAGVQVTSLNIWHYAAGTTTLQDVWTTRAKASTVAQPAASDANGIVSFYADGLYKFVVKDGTNTLYTYDNVDVLDTSNTGGEGAAIASASTLVLGTDGAYFHVTGAVTITAISGTQNSVTLTFDSTPPLTNSGSLVLLGGVNYTCTAGDSFVFVNDGAGVWREISRTMALKTSFGFGSDSQAFLDNASFTATVGSNNLTIALKTKAAVDPSTTDAVRVAFRSATLTTGTYVVRTITAALSLVVSNTQTLGTANGVAARLYWGLLDNAGTPELYLYNPLSGSNLLALNEQQLYSTSTPGNNAQTLYSTTARSTVAIRVGGYIEISEATAGTWATAPTVLNLMGAGVKRTGDLVQTVITITGAMATGTTTFAHDNNTPQNTAGDQYMTQAITPTSTINRLFIETRAYFASNVSGTPESLGLFQDSTANALGLAATWYSNSANRIDMLDLVHEMAAGTTSSTTFKVRIGNSAANTTTFNGESGAQIGNGTLRSYMKVTEVFV